MLVVNNMKSKFKIKNNLIIKICVMLIIIFSIYLFVIFFNNTDFRYILIDRVNLQKYNYFDNVSKSKLVYLSLNKFASYDKYEEIIDEVIYEEETKVDVLPSMYIYNSHQTEGYDYKLLDHTVKPNVLYASYILKDYFNNYGLEVIVENSSMKDYLTKNKLDYDYSYQASRYYMDIVVNKYPSIKYFIDIHRDSATIKKTLYEYDKKRYARIMFVVGMNHPNSDKNLEFVTKLNNMINEKYKGLSRGIYKRNDAKFNQDISSTAILIELGGVDNTLEEINNTLEIFSSIYIEYIGEYNGE